MTLLKPILSTLLLAAALSVSAQTVKPSPSLPSGDVNKKDSKGKPDGMWVLSAPPRMGEPGFTEFGLYDHGHKAGIWYKMDGAGQLTSSETFRNNVLDGEAKYYENGRLTCIGYYRGLNPQYPFDTFYVTDPETHKEIRRIIPTERSSLKHGTWRFYDADNGRLMREEDYQIDELVYHKDYPYTKEDSLKYAKRATQLPHNKKKTYTPPVTKQVSYN
ncbi:MAG TPA: hypothetical protein VK167_14605 [Flavipsychrobacter sp.]|nr:hypothetical protein [Flavipsychrobacter sp.]